MKQVSCLSNTLESSGKVGLIYFSEQDKDKKDIDRKSLIEFNCKNFLEKLSEKEKRVHFGQSARFYNYKIESKIIVTEVLHRDMIGFGLFQNKKLLAFTWN
jgi:hypothetical protein